MDTLEWRAAQRRLRESLRPEPPAGEEQAPRPLVSVVVVCWNAGRVLGRCLEQLLAQDYSPYEVIVVDDGSEDDTLAVAERAAAGCDRVRIVRSPRNRGCPHARNLGIAAAAGEVVAFIDSDGFADRRWLAAVVRALGRDRDLGGVASTVFVEANPLVVNGAGGTVNRQGWAADLAMNEPYDSASLATEALYPMGCGMAFRREAIERVGRFDDAMLNYYDDVDYGIRVWRAGYRIGVAPDAWIDHDLAPNEGVSARRRLLCERHRMRVVLTHAPARELALWVRFELAALRAATGPVRAAKLRGLAWNAARMPGLLARRRRLRGMRAAPAALVDPSWGEGFPPGVPELSLPRLEGAGAAVEMGEPQAEAQLLHGWFPLERAAGRSYRWAGPHAGVLLSCPEPAARLRLDFAHVPVDTGGIDVAVRRLQTGAPPAAEWSAHLPWQYLARTVQNHPVALEAGVYEVLFSARGWLEPPLATRNLGMALSGVALAPLAEIAAGGLDMAAPAVEEQLICGWYEGEAGEGRAFRWAARSASALVRAAQAASAARVVYRLPPSGQGGLRVRARALGTGEEDPGHTAELPRPEGEWHVAEVPLQLAAGDHVVTFAVDATWSNVGGRDPALWPENRELGFAIAELALLETP